MNIKKRMNSSEQRSLVLIALSAGFFVAGCQPLSISNSLVPAEAFSKAAQRGKIEDYSFKKAAQQAKQKDDDVLAGNSVEDLQTAETYAGDSRLTEKGLFLKRSFSAPSVIATDIDIKKENTMGGGVGSARGQLAGQGPASSPYLLAAATAPLASSAPYLQGQMTANPSLWPDHTEGAFLFNDHRAFNPMDILTIVINDNTQGNKQGNTNTKTEFDLLAGITNFFGIETKSWESNNEGLDASALIRANTENEFKGQAQIQRQGTLKAQVSAVVMEVLPNGILRVEGSKIVAINNEEEIMVVSGLVRKRDIASDNKVDSNRIANMRIDFYGHGTLSESQSPGWGARLFNTIWPF